jgi:spermidine dehydrogenase
MVDERDEDLGMHRPITRRDFVNGSAMALAGAAVGAALPRDTLGAPVADLNRDPYPPALTGMRGSGYPGAYATGHALRDGSFWGDAPAPVQTSDRYDLIIVGAGISGLAAAYFFQKRNGFGKRVLILDNHDAVTVIRNRPTNPPS